MSNSPYKTVREALNAADAALKEAEKIAIATNIDNWGDTQTDAWQASSMSC